jgi:hypothetical protein
MSNEKEPIIDIGGVKLTPTSLVPGINDERPCRGCGKRLVVGICYEPDKRDSSVHRTSQLGACRTTTHERPRTLPRSLPPS